MARRRVDTAATADPESVGPTPPPWIDVPAPVERAMRARYLAARERAGGVPLAWLGEGRRDAAERLGGPVESVWSAARFDSDEWIRREAVTCGVAALWTHAHATLDYLTDYTSDARPTPLPGPWSLRGAESGDPSVDVRRVALTGGADALRALIRDLERHARDQGADLTPPRRPRA